MSLNLSGVTTDPLQNPVYTLFRFVRKDGLGSPYYNEVEEYETDASGNYTFSVEYGIYDIYIYTKIDKKTYLLATVSIDENTAAVSVNDLIEQQ